MSITDWFKPNDPEVVKLTLCRLDEQDNWNDVFSTKLIELLDKIDAIKREIRERMRKADERIQKAESATQAESLLLEEAEKAENLANKLADAETTLIAMRGEFQTAKSQYEGAQQLREESEEILAEAESKFGGAQELLAEAAKRHQSGAGLAGAAQRAYREARGALEEASSSCATASQRLAEAQAIMDKAAQSLQAADRAQQWAVHLATDARRIAEKASGDLNAARNLAEDAAIRLKSARDLADVATNDLQLAIKNHVAAARLSTRIICYATVAVALSWTAMGWTIAFAHRSKLAWWIAFGLSVLLASATPLILRKVQIDA
jgi:chromosome segregation ATPase